MQLSKSGSTDASSRRIALILAALFLVSLIPLLLIAAYSRPALDDYVHGLRTHEVFRSTGSVLSALGEAFSVMIDTWKNWQGSYTDIFLSALQPGIFGEKAYWIDPVLTFVFFIAGNLYFMDAFLRRLLKLNLWCMLSFAFIHMTLFIQLPPDPAQGFYWHCSTCAYLWMFSLTQLFAGLLVKSYLTGKKRYLWLCPLVGFLTAGCNFSTVLLVLLLLICYLGILILKKRKEPAAVLSLVAFIAGFLISVLAPGNAVRMAGYGVNIGPVEAILTAMLDSMHLIAEWTTLPFLALELAALPFLWPIVKRISFRFRFPLLVPVFGYLLVAAGLTPLVYGYGEISQWATRVYNLLFFLYAIVFEISLAYFMGWARRVTLEAKDDAGASPIGIFTKYLYGLFAAVLTVICVSGYSSMRNESFYAFRFSHMSSVSAFFSLKNGEAQGFAGEMDARLPALYDENETDPRFAPLKHKPYVLLVQDISEDPNGWVNVMWQGYYHKNSIALER